MNKKSFTRILLDCLLVGLITVFAVHYFYYSKLISTNNYDKTNVISNSNTKTKFEYKQIVSTDYQKNENLYHAVGFCIAVTLFLSLGIGLHCYRCMAVLEMKKKQSESCIQN